MKKILSIFSVVALFIFASCTDNDYDLSDVDTTARFNVKDLVVPVNLDDITLDYVLDLSEDSKVKKNGNEYAVIEEGTFSSNAITVNSFTTAGSTTHASQEIPINLGTPAPTRAKRIRPDAGIYLGSATIPTKTTAINASAHNVDPSIVSIDSIGVELQIKLAIQFTGLTNVIKQIDIEDLTIQFIKGLTLTIDKGEYNPETGIIAIGDAQTTMNHNYDMTIDITAIDAAKAGIQFANGNFDFSTTANVASGRLALYLDQVKSGLTIADIPTVAGYDLSATIGTGKITSFSGDIRYDITGININPIDLTNIPEMLTQDGTNIELANPQIYLSLNNPLIQSGYNLYAQTGLKLTGNAPYSTTANAIKLDKADNMFVLSPQAPATNYQGYENAKHVLFADLGKVVSGSSVPQSVSIDVLSPQIPTQTINKFQLGTTLPAVNGKWLFYAPLDLTDNSFIKYTKSWDDWQDDDLDGLTVQQAAITCVMSSDVPLALDVTFKLLGKKGTLTGSTKLAANAKNVDINIPLSGTDVSQIYGMTIDAKINGSNKPLAPNQKIVVKNLKAKVTGYYDKEL